MDVGKMIVELLYWIVEGACFLFSSSMLVTHFLGYAPRKGRGGKCVLLVVWFLYAVTGWLLYVAFHSRLPEGEGQSTTLNGGLCLFLLVYWTFRLNVKKGKAFLLTFAMIELMMVLMGICGTFFAVATEGMELSATGERISDILYYLVWSAIILGMSLISGRRRKGPMPSIQVFSIFLITLLVNLVLSFLNPGSYLSQNQPIFTLRLSYDGTNGDAILNGMVLLIGLGILLVTMLLSIRDSEVRYFRDKNLLNEYYLETQKEHYEQQSEANREMRRIRHDVKNHAYVMQELLRRKDYGELEKYLSQLTKEMEQADVSVHVGNDIADAILSEKKQKAEKLGIVLKVDGEMTGVSLSALDTCTILANVLDNAIEAVEGSKEDGGEAMEDGSEGQSAGQQSKQEISLQFRKSNNFLLITETNPAREGIVITDGVIQTSKKDKENHGFGLTSIREAVERYDGQCVLTAKDGQFTIEIMLPLSMA